MSEESQGNPHAMLEASLVLKVSRNFPRIILSNAFVRHQIDAADKFPFPSPTTSTSLPTDLLDLKTHRPQLFLAVLGGRCLINILR